MPNPQTVFDVVIESVVFGGKGLARVDNKVVFVPDVLPGEEVRIRFKKYKSDYVEGELLKILKPSRLRKAAPEGFLMPETSLVKAPLAYSPGYCYYYTTYANEIKLKQTQFAAFWEKHPTFKKKIMQKAIVSPEDTHYRNKIKLNFQNDHGMRELGYVMADNQSVLDLPACALARPEINAMLQELRAKSGFMHSLQPRMALTLRYTPYNGVTVWRNQPAHNASWLKEESCLGTISTPQGSFYQVNVPVANMLIQQVQAWLTQIQADAVFDLYCGSGIFALAAGALPTPPEFVAGIDLDPNTIAAARYNAKNLEMPHLRFERGTADKIFESYGETLRGANACIIVDPPRTGLHPRLGHQIANSGVKNLIYVSCSPDTLMRDLVRLARAGYVPQETRMADMFPRTPHFETLTLLRKES